MLFWIVSVAELVKYEKYDEEKANADKISDRGQIGYRVIVRVLSEFPYEYDQPVAQQEENKDLN